MNDHHLALHDLQALSRSEEALMRQRLLLSNLYTKRNAYSVTCRLPTEILETIFSHFVRDYHQSYPGPPDSTAPSWINISYVCRHWRDIALNCPTLWAHIFITAPRWTEELLARSKQASLKIRGEILFPSDDPLLPSLEKVLDHRERIEDLCIGLPIEYSQPFFEKLFSSHTPRLQNLEISVVDFHSNLSSGVFHGHGDTPALRTLRLSVCPVSWYLFNLGALTCLNLYGVPAQFQQDTATFLTTLGSMRNLRHLYLEEALASAVGFTAIRAFSSSQKIRLPHLSRLLIGAPLSTVIAFLSCVDIPLKAEVRLKCCAEAGSCANDYSLLSSILSQRLRAAGDQTLSSPTICTLFISFAAGHSTLTCSTSLELYVDDTSYEAWDCNIPLKVVVQYGQSMMPVDGIRITRDMCLRMPLTEVQNLQVFRPPFSPRFWKTMLGHLGNVRHITLSEGNMPDLASVLTIPIAGQSRDAIVAPALTELELERIAFSLGDGPGLYSYLPEPGPAITPSALFSTLSSRGVADGRLVFRRCRIGVSDRIHFADVWGNLHDQPE